VVFDGKPYSSPDTRKVAEVSDLIVIPSGPTSDDLDPQILLAHELTKGRIPASRILFVINSLSGDLDGLEARDARLYVEKAGYRVAKSMLLRRSSYGQAHNIGKSISEVTAPSLRAQAIGVVEEIGAIMKESVAA
jgi:chromosome partitioning protein